MHLHSYESNSIRTDGQSTFVRMDFPIRTDQQLIRTNQSIYSCDSIPPFVRMYSYSHESPAQFVRTNIPFAQPTTLPFARLNTSIRTNGLPFARMEFISCRSETQIQITPKVM